MTFEQIALLLVVLAGAIQAVTVWLPMALRGKDGGGE